MTGTDEGTPRVVAGRYRLEGIVGRGGMGVVWRAMDTLLVRRVALKELRAPSGVSESDESSFIERALREARNAGRLNHPGVVAVHDVIAPSGDDDAVYVVMEYVPAPTLAEVLDTEGPLPAARVVALGSGILDAVTAAHALGIVHRDIKPGNVLVRDGDRVKLTDFGIALAAEDTRLTRSGVIGTHAYMAPECFESDQPGPAADLWALGATLFHAVAGRAPFDRDTTTATLRAILFENLPPPPCEPPLADVITGLLTRPVDQRLTSVTARDLLQQVAKTLILPQPTVEAPATAGAPEAAWEAQATTVHRPPPTAQHPVPSPARPWGGQPALPSPTSGGRSRAAAVVVCMVLLLVAVVGAASYMTSADDDNAGGGEESSSPGTDGLPTFNDGAQGTILAFFDAMNNGDCEVLAELVTESMLRENMPVDASEAEVMKDCEQQAQSLGAVVLGGLDLVDEDAESVHYNAKYSMEDVGEAHVAIRLVRGQSRWLIDELEDLPRPVD